MRCGRGKLTKILEKYPQYVHEVTRVLGKLKNGKAPGSSRILPEMLKVGRKDTNFEEMVWDLVKAVWEEKCVPQEWVNAILIPIPKKGNLHSCDNWRGIAVMGKVVARVIQGRQHEIWRRRNYLSLSVVRKGRGCTDTWSSQSGSSQRRQLNTKQSSI